MKASAQNLDCQNKKQRSQLNSNNANQDVVLDVRLSTDEVAIVWIARSICEFQTADAYDQFSVFGGPGYKNFFLASLKEKPFFAPSYWIDFSFRHTGHHLKAGCMASSKVNTLRWVGHRTTSCPLTQHMPHIRSDEHRCLNFWHTCIRMGKYG